MAALWLLLVALLVVLLVAPLVELLAAPSGESVIEIGRCAVMRLRYLVRRAGSWIASIFWICGLLAIAAVGLAVSLALDVISWAWLVFLWWGVVF